MNKGGGGYPSVVHPRLPAGLKFRRGEPRVRRRDPFVGREACGLLADAGQRPETRCPGLGIARHQYTELQLGQSYNRNSNVLRQGLGKLTALLNRNEDRRIEDCPSTHAWSMT